MEKKNKSLENPVFLHLYGGKGKAIPCESVLVKTVDGRIELYENGEQVYENGNNITVKKFKEDSIVTIIFPTASIVTMTYTTERRDADANAK